MNLRSTSYLCTSIGDQLPRRPGSSGNFSPRPFAPVRQCACRALIQPSSVVWKAAPSQACWPVAQDRSNRKLLWRASSWTRSPETPLTAPSSPGISRIRIASSTPTCRPRLRFAAVPSLSGLFTWQAFPCAKPYSTLASITPTSAKGIRLEEGTHCKSLKISAELVWGRFLIERRACACGIQCKIPGACACQTLESASRGRTAACPGLFSAVHWLLQPGLGKSRLAGADGGPVPSLPSNKTSKHVLHIRKASHAGLELIGISNPHRS